MILYLQRIIEPLTSRCSKFRFKPLSTEVLQDRLEEIVKAEGMVCEEGVIDKVISTSQGDMRKAITLLQSACHLKGTEAVTGEDILEIAGVSYSASSVVYTVSDPGVLQVVPAPLIQALFNACYSSSYDQLESKVKELLAEGYSVSQVLLQLHDLVVPMGTITDVQKSVITERMGVSQFSVTVGVVKGSCRLLIAS